MVNQKRQHSNHAIRGIISYYGCPLRPSKYVSHLSIRLATASICFVVAGRPIFLLSKRTLKSFSAFGLGRAEFTADIISVALKSPEIFEKIIDILLFYVIIGNNFRRNNGKIYILQDKNMPGEIPVKYWYDRLSDNC